MLRIQILSAATLLLLASAAAAAAAAEFDAASYHDAQCMKCHGTEVYTRDPRRVNSFGALESQVAMCDANLGTKLFPDDLALLVEHLNTNFYKFNN
jgi:hypothetical protein